MPLLLKLVIYFVVLGLVGMLHNAIPKSEHEMRILVAFVAAAWFFGGILIVFRAVFRFITR